MAASYGIGYGGVGFGDDAHQVQLADLSLRRTERFTYHYDFVDRWRLDLRVEQIVTVDLPGGYPRCTGGRRAGPPQDCGGAWAFLDQTQTHRVYDATVRVGRDPRPAVHRRLRHGW